MSTPKKKVTKAKPKRRLYEITAMVTYSAVILATSKKEALRHVESWELAWDANADCIGVSDVELTDVRDGSEEDAHDVAVPLEHQP